MPPVIALLTDFGLRDHYVAAMKGVILGICRDATLVDITHDIPPQDVAAAALELAACYASFPSGTIFVAVVDPGVGSRRRAIAARAHGCLFVAPDNGLLSPILATDRSCNVVELTRPQYAAASVSRTFEGRDRFAPAAAWLATGVGLEAMGNTVPDWISVDLPRPAVKEARIEGQVVRVDRFGNLVTNISGGMLDDVARHVASGILAEPRPTRPLLPAPHASEAERHRLRVTVAGGEALPLVSTYSDVPAGTACALVGSTGHVEVSVNGGSAAERLGAARGARVTVEFQS